MTKIQYFVVGFGFFKGSASRFSGHGILYFGSLKDLLHLAVEHFWTIASCSAIEIKVWSKVLKLLITFTCCLLHFHSWDFHDICSRLCFNGKYFASNF